MSIAHALQKGIGHSFVNHKGDIGIEIETETQEPYDTPKFSFWNIHNDGSLRGFGVEYVAKRPLEFEKELPEALDEFRKKTEKIAFIPDSITTSVHVHLNFLKEDLVTLANFFTIYALMENLLVRFAGENRRSNGFCLPIQDAEETYLTMRSVLNHMAERQWQGMFVPVDNCKYAGLNLSSLSTYGSLEVRLFRGETDIKIIHNWVTLLYRMLEYSRQKGLTPPQIITFWKDNGRRIIREVFKDEAKFLNRPDEEQLIDENFWYAGNLAYLVKDWERFNSFEKPKKGKTKDVETLSVQLFQNPFDRLTANQQREIMRMLERGQQPAGPREDIIAHGNLEQRLGEIGRAVEGPGRRNPNPWQNIPAPEPEGHFEDAPDLDEDF